MADSYDAIVVGAGPAGSAAAYIMAQNALSVTLLERGPYPGSKTMFGGTVYRRPLEEIVPAFWQEAPLERPVVKDELWFMEGDSAVNVGFTGLRFGKDPYNKFTAQRSVYDTWFANKAVQAGADLRTSTLATGLVYDKSLLGRRQDRVIGVKLDTGEEMHADVVVLAEGVNAFLTKEAGLRREIPPHAMTFYVEEVVALEAGKINERFQLEGNEGATYGMIGYPTAGTVGKGGIYTYKEHVAIVVGSYLDQMSTRSHSPYELLQRFKNHPLIKRLIQGGETVHYKANLIPKGGYDFIPRLYMDGLLVAGDAAMMISGRRGTDLAALTGMHAAETVVQAKAKGDFSSRTLATYMHKLNNTFFMKDIRSARGGLRYYRRHPDSDYLVASVLNDMAYEFFTVDMSTKSEKRQRLMKTALDRQVPSKTLMDLYEGYQHWGVF